MLLPDNIQPELSIYYNGALVLEEVKREEKQSILNVYQKKKSAYDMSFPTFVLCLDWLYLIEAVKVNEGGNIELCL